MTPDTKDKIGIAITLLLGLFILLNTTGCGSLGPVPETPPIKGRGPCFWWTAIDKEDIGNVLCWESYPLRPEFRCIRKKGHSLGKHHSHSYNSCLYQWR